MATRTGTARRKTRHILRKSPRQRGRISIRSVLQKFAEGDRVILKADPSHQKGMYFRRFHGHSGIVKRQCGSSYEVAVQDDGKQKLVVVKPVHLRRV